MRPLAVVLLVVGLSRLAADGLGALFDERPVLLDGIASLATATGIAPAPGLLSAVNGLETFSTRYHLEGTRRNGSALSVELTPERFARLAGPGDRRDVYRAALVYGPVLAVDPALGPLWEAVLRYALCGEAPLLVELGIDPGELSGPVFVRCEPLPGSDLSGLPSVFGAPCP